MSKTASGKTKKELYETYLKFHDLESLISEMTNSVVHSQDPNPIIYMIKYLTGLLTEEERTEYGINILPPYPQGFPIVKFPKFQNTNVLKKYLTKDNWYSFKHKKTSYNNDINNLTYLSDHSKTNKIGMSIVDNDCITTFEGLVEKVIYDVHQISDEQQGRKILYKVANSPAQFKTNLFFYDEFKEYLEKVQYIFYRNIEGYTYNNIDKRNGKLKQDIEHEIQNWMNDGLLSKDMTKITNIEEFINQNSIISQEYTWMKEAGFISKNYTLKDRAIYANPDNSLIILINFSNHFEIISTVTEFTDNKLVENYNKIMGILKQASVRFTFDVDPKFGYLTSDISLLGGGFRIIANIKVKNKNNFNEKLTCFERIKGEINNDIATVSAHYILKDGDISKFLAKFFVDIYLLALSSKESEDTKLKIDLNKHQFKNNNPLALAYDATFNEIKKNLSFSGSNINDLMQPYFENEDESSLIFNTTQCYYIYETLIKKYIESRDGLNIEINGHMSKPEDPRDISNLESKDFIASVNKLYIVLSRNISSFPFPIIKNFNSYKQKAEEIIKNTLEDLNSKKPTGTYYSMKDAKDIISKNNIEIFQKNELKKYGFDDTFPEYRGVIVFKKQHIFATINDMNNINFFLIYNNPTEEDNLREGMENFINIVNTFSYKIQFSFDVKYGFHTALMKYLGTGIKINAEVKLKKADTKFLDVWSKDKKIKWSKCGTDGDKSIIKLENMSSFGQSETEMLCNWLYYLSDISLQD